MSFGNRPFSFSRAIWKIRVCVRPTANADFGTICAVNLRRAHRAIETGKTVGKITLSGFVR